ncbi:mannitol-1-phosphate 5-dehydrogenase [Paenibacillus polymyxa]|jgi:mannitol-1-phosphate 5-dehydrogenase|uniref:Mannitol-1-phosphate 5-dehydrogenase n=1 Tax=Paenibacillus polymyxa TaxID=1406 RepID=A0A378Y386_PAEPO|nr:MULTISPECIES: mannitol-1-phosphate 5-dehydrogenase [Paenibacillus]KAF6615561.1 mannitol-1-phosphate 5-dehydrogenase [Paenibacillus sp. EKM101P]KAF6619927.1 mannitol-1-phosphate 5-dehydrogenase [Paenibacillus sp. EKM102P]KAF6628496.1 mannitol-1-phosphate 5-dehydrogenase [Paenibacillus sp. EKM10P]KAF6644482.1 mannitol-1-phosphate 5-dehydrogenase [Paenibacillus sp. EKM11P]MBE7899141.1 mannitol-1-phosphate 5-dehydrogenase [Paenibacillus polymyxa]
MRAVHFGAGNIGRGFIGLILSRAGYEVVFSDVNETLVSELRRRKQYTVELANDTKDTETVTNVTAIDGRDASAVADAVDHADLVTTAVGVSILRHIAAGIAEGIARRVERGAGPLHVIACENAIGGSAQLKEHVFALLDEATRAKAEASVYFPNAAVDRIVPIQHHEDPLHVQVEPFYEWVVDRSQMAPDHQEIEGILYVQDLEPYIERKLFTVNTGHCVAAYIGYVAGYATIQEAMKDTKVVDSIHGALEETGAVLVKRFGLNQGEHKKYIAKILDRFRNPNLTDEVTRVGRSPLRKLSPNDRLVRPALQAQEYGIPTDHLALGMAAACKFDITEDPEAVELQQVIRSQGVSEALTRYTSIPADDPLHRQILEQYDIISS